MILSDIYHTHFSTVLDELYMLEETLCATEELSDKEKQIINSLSAKQSNLSKLFKRLLHTDIFKFHKLITEVSKIKLDNVDSNLFKSMKAKISTPHQLMVARGDYYVELSTLYSHMSEIVKEPVNTTSYLGVKFETVLSKAKTIGYKFNKPTSLKTFLMVSVGTLSKSILQPTFSSNGTRTYGDLGYTPENAIKVILNLCQYKRESIWKRLWGSLILSGLDQRTIANAILHNHNKDKSISGSRALDIRMRRYNLLTTLSYNLCHVQYGKDLTEVTQMLHDLRKATINHGDECMTLNLFNIDYTDVIGQDEIITSTDIVVDPDHPFTKEIETTLTELDKDFENGEETFSQFNNKVYATPMIKDAAYSQFLDTIKAKHKIFMNVFGYSINGFNKMEQTLQEIQKGLLVKLKRNKPYIPITTKPTTFKEVELDNLISYSEMNHRFIVYAEIVKLLQQKKDIINSTVRYKKDLSDRLEYVLELCSKLDMISGTESIYSDKFIDIIYYTKQKNNLHDAGYNPVDLHRLFKLAETLTEDIEEDVDFEETEISISIGAVHKDDATNYIDSVAARKYRYVCLLQLKKHLLLCGLAQDTAILTRISHQLIHK